MQVRVCDSNESGDDTCVLGLCDQLECGHYLGADVTLTMKQHRAQGPHGEVTLAQFAERRDELEPEIHAVRPGQGTTNWVHRFTHSPKSEHPGGRAAGTRIRQQG